MINQGTVGFVIVPSHALFCAKISQYVRLHNSSQDPPGPQLAPVLVRVQVWLRGPGCERGEQHAHRGQPARRQHQRPRLFDPAVALWVQHQRLLAQRHRTGCVLDWAHCVGCDLGDLFGEGEEVEF
ncbi:hypothetical protein BC938DRAFT_479352 [Jimgerdemannia flammicorona]|uniref:Uncharacterized protein n=1 Tax=Jimgerdemannia flammicorona TaxID=994334 RepID=A0A433QL12_9FUNG|nr:hypothetical protein BC938DRAFT_479352 [Jimgerdemannia flammicorona]